MKTCFAKKTKMENFHFLLSICVSLVPLLPRGFILQYITNIVKAPRARVGHTNGEKTKVSSTL